MQAAIRAEEESVRLLGEAQRERNDKIIAVRLHAYNKAQVGRLAAERLIQEIREREKILVPMDTAKAIIRKFIVPVLNRLRAFPKGTALAVNPSDDIHAESVLRVRIEALIAEVCLEFEPGDAVGSVVQAGSAAEVSAAGHVSPAVSTGSAALAVAAAPADLAATESQT